MSADSIEKIADEMHADAIRHMDARLASYADRVRALPSLAELERDAGRWKKFQPTALDAWRWRKFIQLMNAYEGEDLFPSELKFMESTPADQWNDQMDALVEDERD